MNIWALQIWSSGVSLKRSCKMLFRCVDLVSIGPQKLWPNFEICLFLAHFWPIFPYKIPKSIPYIALGQFLRWKSDFWYSASFYTETARFKWPGHKNEFCFLWDTLAIRMISRMKWDRWIKRLTLSISLKSWSRVDCVPEKAITRHLHSDNSSAARSWQSSWKFLQHIIVFIEVYSILRRPGKKKDKH